MPLLLLLLSQCLHFDGIALLLSLLSLAGGYVCRLVILYLFNKNNPLTAKLCTVAGKFDCDKVLEMGKLSKNTTLADVGLVYFIGLFLYLVIANVFGQSRPAFLLLGILFALAALAACISVVAQWLVIRHWCKMCLMVVAVLWLQAFVLASYFVAKPIVYPIPFLPTIPFAFAFVASLAIPGCWFIAKPFIVKANEVDNIRKQVLRWKKDAGLFLTMLQQQRKEDTSVWENEFVLGNSNAPIKLVDAINLYCPACASQHKQLYKLMQDNPNSIQLVIRFRVTENKADRHTLALKHILNAYFNNNNPQKRSQVLHDWFVDMNLPSWQKKWPNTNILDDNDALMERYAEWFKESGITHTPTLFLNGHEFPKPYIIADLGMLVKPLLALMNR